MSHAIWADRRQMFLLPPSLDDWVAAGHPARFVADLVASLDLKALGFRSAKSGEDGRPHYATELLLSVWLYGWMERVRSSRGLEKACHRDVAFLWLTGNEHPDHNTLWRFFNENRPALRKLFKRVVQVAAKAGLTGFALHALDGTKIRAASSMETAIHRKALEEQLKKLDAIVEKQMEEVDAGEKQPEPDWRMPSTLEEREARRKSILEALAQLDAEETNHLHPSETDARVMRTRGGRPTLAFNAQAVVDHDSDLIVAVDVSGDETDHPQLVPMVQNVLDTLGQVAEHTVADAGYASGEQFEEAERRHLPVLVNVQQESSGKGAYAKSRFAYDAERDVYLCPRGETLPYQKIQNPSTGKPVAMRVYRCHNAACPVKSVSVATNSEGLPVTKIEDDAAAKKRPRYPGAPADGAPPSS